MGTKNNPGSFDCYAAAKPEEPMFILLGRDPMAASLVRRWAVARYHEGEEIAKVIEALDCADALEAWARQAGKIPRTASISHPGRENADRELVAYVARIREGRDFLESLGVVAIEESI